LYSTGAFGTVFKGTLTVYHEDNPTLIDVAIKTIKAGMYVCTYKLL